ncbi:MAG: hypothetical protein IKB99_07370, partial [Lentisphaeria bacterium]|nr:hypothetical protein [Lentisphaeria bacterium]
MNSGSLVIYKGKAALISAVSKDKIEIRTQDGENRSVRMKDVELLHPGPVTALNFPEMPNVEWQELQELADGCSFSFAEFTELAFGNTSPAAAWWTWNILKEGLYFTGSVESGVTLQDPEKTAEMLKKNQEKENKKKLRDELIARIKNNSVTPDDFKFLREIEAVGNGESESSSLMKELGIEAAPNKAHALLCRLGVWQELYDPWPARLGVDIEMPQAQLAELPGEEREDLTSETAYAIDDASSNDPDDAIAFKNGLLYVHVADP